MQEYRKLGHMEAVDSRTVRSPYYFLPHHAVLKPDSSTTKLRVVFDASAKTSSNISLNDSLLVGPTVQGELFTTLLRFRMPRYVFTADIEKMYRQIWVREEDRNYQLIWWRDEPKEPLRCYQLCTVTYGTSSAPYLATKCLQRLAESGKKQYPLGADVLARDFYVDDVMTGSDHLFTAIEMKNQLKELLQTAGFKLRKWCANHPKLLQDLPKEDIEVELDFLEKDQPHIKTLGLTWLPKSDSFKVKTSWPERHKITKRIVCSETAHIFDPLGLVGPATVLAKMFLQKLWLLKLDWDAALPLELHTEWNRFREELRMLDEICVPRHACLHKTPDTIQLHVFADASEKAFGAAAYIRTTGQHSTITAHLLCSRSRVAPLKTLSIPRLELCAAKLAVDLATRIQTDLGVNTDRTFFWTDSEIVLCWINSSSSSLHTFVANRVSAIQQLTTSQQWRHVKSKENPADLLSRGISPSKLKDNCLWFYGPPFLHGQESVWPAAHTPKLENIPESRKTVLSAISAGEPQNLFDTINHGNSFRKLQRIIAYMNRFIKGARGMPRTSSADPSLTANELEEALTIIVKQMQQKEFSTEIAHLRATGESQKNSKLSDLTPFLDEKGIIRVGGRLRASELPFDAKHQIVLPYAHPVTKLILKDFHEENQHTGAQALLAIVRQRFWPIKGKTLARSVVQHCLRCFRTKPKQLSQLMGDLPARRVQPARPFVNAGVDFCGPVWTHYQVRGKRPQKSYIAVFCCFATKAVHLELVTNLTTDAFIGALKRFMARRGHCRHLHCDNATNFIGAQAQLAELKDAIHSERARSQIQSLCGTHGMDFHFIPPRAPHFGGLWEAAVKSAKTLLRRSVAAASLTYEELETVVTEVEAVLNSRPLTPMSSDPNDLSALTPGHFLIGEPLASTIHPEASPEKLSLLTRWKLVAHIKNEFWKRWSAEYLNELQQRQKWRRKIENIKPGTMVILKEDNLPPMKWPLGRVVSTHKGEDGLIRVADVRTAKSVLRRPIHRLAPLPIETDDPVPATNEETNLPTTSGAHEQPARQDENPTPRKRIRISPMSAIATVLLTCIILPLTTGAPIETKPFNSQPGVYFENLGSASIISNEWNIIAYYEMAGYWKEFHGLVGGHKALVNICSQLQVEDPCSTILAQMQQLIRELTDNNELLSPQPLATRRKRGALNIVGNIANSLFGVLDSEYAEKMSKTIDDTRKNEDHLLQLIRNQTSIIDSSINVIKKTEEEVARQFNSMQARITQLNNGITRIQEELREQKLSTLFTSLTTQMLLATSNIQRMQTSLIEVLVQSQHGRISPKLITPQQLKQQLILIKANLRSSLKLPRIENNIVQLYTIMDVAAKAMTNRIMFKISIPLLNTEEFELLKVLSIPFLINDTFVAVAPSSPFLVVNLHRDQYYPLTEQELQSCVSIRDDNHMCKQNHPVYQRGSNQSSCEMDLINNMQLPSTCRIISFPRESQWIQLNNPNQWIYSVRKPEMIKVACGSDVTSMTIEGSGILKMQGNCIIKQNQVTIQGHNIYPTVLRSSYIPATNITQIVLPEQVAQLKDNFSSYHIHQSAWEKVEAQLRLQQENSNLPSSLPGHEVHQFSIAYIGCAISVGMLIYVVWRFRVYTYTPPAGPTPRKRTREEVPNTSRADAREGRPPRTTVPTPTFTIDLES